MVIPLLGSEKMFYYTFIFFRSMLKVTWPIWGWNWNVWLWHFIVFWSVAKRTSVFDDPTLEIQELTAVIKQDITALNAAVVDLQLLCNSQNESGNISSDTTTHSTTVVDNLKNRLMTATKEFKEVLTMRTEVIWNLLFNTRGSSIFCNWIIAIMIYCLCFEFSVMYRI